MEGHPDIIKQNRIFYGELKLQNSQEEFVMKRQYRVLCFVVFIFVSVFFIGCTTTGRAVRANSQEKLYYFLNGEYSDLFLDTNEFWGEKTLYYLDKDGKTKYPVFNSEVQPLLNQKKPRLVS
jgi:hypothetical protein